MRALLLVDIQNDFVPGGALPVLEGNQIVSVANTLQTRFPLVVATQDWHPSNHFSFAANHPGKKPGDTIQLEGGSQILWPIHCVQETWGAAFLPDLNTNLIQKVIQKGADPEIDSYSGFYDNARQKDTGLADFLRLRQTSHLYVMGLATDYCVKFTALDALWLGFQVTLVQDGCRGVNLNPGDVEHALKEMQSAGVRIVNSEDV